MRIHINKKGIVKFLKDNKWVFLQMGIMMLPSAIGLASAGVTSGDSVSTGITALNTPLTTLNTAMTGAVPKVGVTIAAAAGGLGWALGTEQQVVKYATRAGIGGGCAMAAPSLIGSVTGCIF